MTTAVVDDTPETAVEESQEQLVEELAERSEQNMAEIRQILEPTRQRGAWLARALDRFFALPPRTAKQEPTAARGGH